MFDPPSPLPSPVSLVDSFGRVHTSVRLSVTDRCNIRCFYCMPATGVQFFPRDQILSFEEIERLANLLVRRAGIRDLRITGGEPLVRRELDHLIGRLASIDGLEDLSLTTNGMLLAEQALALRRAGLKRLNISLDTLDPDTFLKISRRNGLQQTIEGIDAAIECGFESIKLNALAIRGISEPEIVRLLEFALERGVVLRFIEFMPLDTDRKWQAEQVFSGDEILELVRLRFGKIEVLHRSDPSQPAEEFALAGGRFGIIRSVTRPFCQSCNRLRITAEGSVRNCLFSEIETPLRDRMRNGASDDELLEQIQNCVQAKAAAHGIQEEGFKAPERPMYAIGG
ncbi:MAG: GTP 3',8-cyclase MoaA [Planctomycetota bacterium]